MEPKGKSAEYESTRIHALIKERVYSQTLEQKYLHYSYVEKKNNSGIMHNDRILIVFDREGVGYISKLDEKFVLPFQSLARVPKRKVTIPFDRITSVERKDGSLEIKYRKDDKGKGDPEVWSLRMPSEKMMEDWERIIEVGRKPPPPKLSTVSNISQLVPGQKKPGEYIGVGDDPVVDKKTDEVQTKPMTTNDMTQTEFKPPPPPPSFQKPITNAPLPDERPIFSSAINESKQLDDKHPSGVGAGRPSQYPSLLNSGYSKPTSSVEPFRPTNSVVTFHDKKGSHASGVNNDLQSSAHNPSIPHNSDIFQRDHGMRQTGSKMYLSGRKPDGHDYRVNVYEPQKDYPEEPGENWNEHLLRAEDPSQLVIRFKHVAEEVVKDVIDDLGLPPKMRRYRPSKPFTSTSDYSEFSTKGLNIVLSFSQPKENPVSKQPVYDETSTQLLQNYFFNMNHVFYSTENSGRVRVPLAVLVEYRGIVALAKAVTAKPSSERTIIPLDLQEHLAGQTNIHRKVFDEGSNLRAVEVAASPDSNYFLDDVAVLLPEDHFQRPFAIANRLPSAFVLRQEFTTAKLYSADNRLAAPNRKGAEGPLISSHYTNERMEELVNSLLDEMENLSYVVVTSTYVEELFQERCVPSRYVGLIGQKTTVQLVRQVCFSYVAAQSCSAVLRNELQEIIKNGSTLGSDLLDDREALIARSKYLSFNCLLELINTILSDNKESELLWKIISNQAENEFHCRIERKDIVEGFFLQALAYHFRIKVRWDSFNHALYIFRRDVKYFTKDNIDGMEAKVTVFDYGFSRSIKEVYQILAEHTEDSVRNLIYKLKLREAAIPEVYSLRSLDKRIKVFVSSFLSPHDSSPKSLELYRHYQLYPLSSCDFKVLQNEIRWAMKDPNSDKHNRLSKYLTSRIVRWCGEFHPFVIELNQLFSGYYNLKGDHENAVTMSKSSLACCIKTVGSHSLRTADQYYQLGDIEESCSRREDALISYRKSRAIFENEHRTNTISYGIINSKVARLDIYYGRIADAENSLVKAISIFEHNRESCEPELSEAIELLSRCYEVADNIPELRKLSEQYDRQLHLIQDPLALEKVMKLVVQAKVKQTPKGLKDRALQLIDSLPLRFNQDNYIKGYESLRDILSKDRSLLRPLQHQFESLEDVLPEIKRYRLLEDWDGMLPLPDISTASIAVAFWASLVYFMGQSFIMGSLEFS